MSAHRLRNSMLLALLLAGSGCAHHAPATVSVCANPIFVPASNHDVLWERTVDVLHDYPFYLVRENKLDGVIETDYKVGSGILEPWHEESIGCEERLESTLQSIRRKVLVTLTPQEGGYLVGVEAIKELEDAAGPVPTGAPFAQSTPFDPAAILVGPQAAPIGWIPLGRDFLLEQDILQRLQVAYAN